MATSTLADQSLTSAWVDLTIVLGTLASAACLLQNQGPEDIAIVFGGGDPTALGKSGVVLGRRDSLAGTAANVWARALQNTAKVSVLLT